MKRREVGWACEDMQLVVDKTYRIYIYDLMQGYALTL